MRLIRSAEPNIYTPVDDSLVLWISGSGRGVGSKVFDLSGKGNHGTIYGACWKNTPIGHSTLSFDGVDDYVNCGNDESLNMEYEVTLDVWIKDSGYNNPSYYDLIVGKGGWSVNTPYAIFREYETGKFKAHFGNGNDYLNIDFKILNEKWGHLVAVFKNGYGITYTNGIYSNKGYLIPPLKANSNSVFIGGGLSNRYFKGLIGHVRIFNRALSKSEVMELFNRYKHLYGY